MLKKQNDDVYKSREIERILKVFEVIHEYEMESGEFILKWFVFDVKSGMKLGEFMRDIEFVMCCFSDEQYPFKLSSVVRAGMVSENRNLVFFITHLRLHPQR